MREWTPSLEIGISEIDEQHRALFETAGSFFAAVKARVPERQLDDLFAFLIEYTLDHFSDEERYMRGIGYPQLPEHMVEHAQFKRQLAALVSQWNSEGASPALVLALVGFLDHWLTVHVTQSDQRIGEFARAKSSR